MVARPSRVAGRALAGDSAPAFFRDRGADCGRFSVANGGGFRSVRGVRLSTTEPLPLRAARDRRHVGPAVGEDVGRVRHARPPLLEVAQRLRVAAQLVEHAAGLVVARGALVLEVCDEAPERAALLLDVGRPARAEACVWCFWGDERRGTCYRDQSADAARHHGSQRGSVRTKVSVAIKLDSRATRVGAHEGENRSMLPEPAIEPQKQLEVLLKPPSSAGTPTRLGVACAWWCSLSKLRCMFASFTAILPPARFKRMMVRKVLRVLTN